MAAFPSPESLARVATRHPWRVVATWAVLFVAAIGLTSTIGSVLTTSAENYIQTDADHGNDLLAERLLGQVPGREIVYVRSDSKDVDDPAFKQMLSGLQAEIGGLKDDIRSVTSYAETNDASMVSKDRRATILPAC